ncbi:MAG: hypothetical protein JXA67_11835, partial [Micromonosporaceae bacterium]|nr:hypothetical protein [Micromonosporaceae bacterium]
VGASPRMRRWLVLSQAGTIAVLGSALGIAVGIGTSCAAMTAYNQEAATHFPVVHPFPLTGWWMPGMSMTPSVVPPPNPED